MKRDRTVVKIKVWLPHVKKHGRKVKMYSRYFRVGIRHLRSCIRNLGITMGWAVEGAFKSIVLTDDNDATML